MTQWIRNLASRARRFVPGEGTAPAGRAARFVPQVAGLAALGLVFIAVHYISYWLRFEGQMGAGGMNHYAGSLAWFVLVKVAVFGWFRGHRGWRHYITFYDLLVLVQAATVATLALILVDLYLLPRLAVPRSIFVIDWGVTVVVLGGARALVRVMEERSWSLVLNVDKVPALIVGANEAGESLLRSIIRNGKLTYQVVGFVDEDPWRVGSRIGGVPVVGTIDETCQLALRHGVGEILLTSGDLSGRQVRRLVDDAQRHGIRVKILPSYEQLITGRVALQPRAVAIEDLLRRKPVPLDVDRLRQWIDDRVLLVTGSAGSIGSEICRQLLRFAPRRIVLVDRAESGLFFLERELSGMAGRVELEVCVADVLDRTRMASVLAQHHPDIIFHAAAYKHVPLMESHPGEAVKNIVTATRCLADLAIEHGVGSFVMISTDKAVQPTSVMGACKRAAELYVQAMADRAPCRFVTVRFGNVLDSAGSVVPIFRQQIAAGGPVTVTDPEMQRFFMTIPEAAGLVIQAGAIGNTGEILVLDMGEPVRIVDLAADMIRLSGLRVGEDVEIVFTGIRPGEKLYEELHITGEKHLPTRHPKITVADRKRRDPVSVLASIERLQSAADGPPEAILDVLRQIVPGFRHGDSVYRIDRRAA
ncbi:MAG: polysaccharide biosynthesis protein [Pirellulales bacterium]|nr:polysaccharide biosynthesis protein [Pirellulales bacterium]